MKLVPEIFSPWKAEGNQMVIQDDQTESSETAAYTVSAPDHRQTGVYPGIHTVQGHRNLIGIFTDESVFGDTGE